MTRTTAQQALHERCDALTPTTPSGEGHLTVAGLATRGLWVALHAEVLAHDEGTVRSVLDAVLDLAGVEKAHAPLAAVVTGGDDPVVDLDRPILCASLELMEEPTPRGITLEDVSQRAHVSLGSLSSTFGDVDQLLADQIAFVADDAAVDALPPDLPVATARVLDQVNAFHSGPRATATLRLLTLTGLTRATARATADLRLHRLLDGLGSPSQVAPQRVALLALDALALSGQTALDGDACSTLRALAEQPPA